MYKAFFFSGWSHARNMLICLCFEFASPYSVPRYARTSRFARRFRSRTSPSFLTQRLLVVVHSLCHGAVQGKNLIKSCAECE